MTGREEEEEEEARGGGLGRSIRAVQSTLVTLTIRFFISGKNRVYKSLHSGFYLFHAEG